MRTNAADKGEHHKLGNHYPNCQAEDVLVLAPQPPRVPSEYCQGGEEMPEERRVFSDNRRDELLNIEKWLNFLCIEGAEEEEVVFRKLRLTSFNEK